MTVLAETLDGLTTHAGHDAAVDLLDRIEENARFHVDSLTADALATGKALFRRHEPLSFVDAAIVAYMHTEGLGYVYAFDDDFDAVEESIASIRQRIPTIRTDTGRRYALPRLSGAG